MPSFHYIDRLGLPSAVLATHSCTQPSKLGLAQQSPAHPLHPPHHTFLPRPQPHPHHGPLNLQHEVPQPLVDPITDSLTGVLVEDKPGARRHLVHQHGQGELVRLVQECQEL